MKTVYDFTVKDVSLKEYANEVLLIVNTATKCGFTPQYEELEKLYEKYHSKGFEILDFPCNQFGQQAPGTDESIHNFCKLTYGTEFPRFKKLKVNGEDADPLYKSRKALPDGTRAILSPPFSRKCCLKPTPTTSRKPTSNGISPNSSSTRKAWSWHVSSLQKA